MTLMFYRKMVGGNCIRELNIVSKKAGRRKIFLNPIQRSDVLGYGANIYGS